jgi:hypothetical protein
MTEHSKSQKREEQMSGRAMARMSEGSNQERFELVDHNAGIGTSGAHAVLHIRQDKDSRARRQEWRKDSKK